MFTRKYKYLKTFPDRLGVRRCYFRPTNEAIDLAKYPPETEAFDDEYRRIFQKWKKPDLSPGTLGLLQRRYRSSIEFEELAQRTRKDYAKCLEYLQPLDGVPLVSITPPIVVKVRDQAKVKHGWHFANYVKSVLSAMFTWAVERGHMQHNPAFKVKKVKKPKDAPEANRPWFDSERANVLEALPQHMRLPISLMMYLGIDPQDALALKRNSIKDGKLDSRRGKTGVPIWNKLPQLLVDEINCAQQHNAITVCANSLGRPWTVDGFRASWRPIKLRLEQEGKIEAGLTLKGLRHTAATILSEMGCDETTIADFLGHKTTAMARHYSRRADKTKKMSKVTDDFEDELNARGTKLSNLIAQSVKP
jgi:integrase